MVISPLSDEREGKRNYSLIFILIDSAYCDCVRHSDSEVSDRERDLTTRKTVCNRKLCISAQSLP